MRLTRYYKTALPDVQKNESDNLKTIAALVNHQPKDKMFGRSKNDKDGAKDVPNSRLCKTVRNLTPIQ